MSVTIVKAANDHRLTVAEQVASRVQRLIRRVPLVPDTLANPTAVRAALDALEDRLLVAVDDGRVVGHLGWHDVPSARRTCRRGAWMPEYAHFAESDDVRDALFSQAAVEWDTSGRQTLMASMLVNEVTEWWHLNGFGTFLHDTVRAPSAFRHPPLGGAIVRAAVDTDSAALAELDVAHCAHYGHPPTFMVPPDPWPAARWNEFVSSRPRLIQIAVVDGAPCGFVRVEFDAADLPMLAHPGSATVTGIFVRPDARTSGIGAALLSLAAAAAGVAGARVVTVDHETTNPAARRFWPRHATTVAVSMMRILERP